MQIRNYSRCILAYGNFGGIGRKVVWIVSSSQACLDTQDDARIIQRRLHLTTVFETLPPYNTHTFWQVVEQPDFPIEVLVKLTRHALKNHDHLSEERCLSNILKRLQKKHETWAYRTVSRYHVQMFEERQRLISDLSADLNEAILRAVRDTHRYFWEENFSYCLHYEYRHVKRAFLMREGRWRDAHVDKSRRVPRDLIFSLDQPMLIDGQCGPLELEDEQACMMLLSVEMSDIATLVSRLPDRLRKVIQLVFWEDKTEKDAARALSISDRTVRNRLQAAYDRLRKELLCEYEEYSLLP
jgi:RNA polymerase sigma factor (sigma-70 family)